MRPNNPNKRLRGRSKGKGGNPLARSYESNGPDVKVRGSALQVADKYAQLARDAQSSGDRVMAESFFQHAEHYYRIVAAAYEQNQPKDRRDGDNDRGGRSDDRNEQPTINGYDGVDEDDDDEYATVQQRGANGSDEQGEGPRHDESESDGEEEARPAARSSRRQRVKRPPVAEPDVTQNAAPSEASGDGTEAQADTPSEPEAKPKRRTRATRPRRPRKADAGNEADQSQASGQNQTETAETTS